MLFAQKDHPEWVERYRPHRVVDCILPEAMKQTFQGFVDGKNIPNLALVGEAGVGKTTLAKAMVDEIGAEWTIINGSLEGRNIDTVRTTIASYASAMSITGGRKYMIIDEADYLNPESVQPALRNLMEDFSQNCGFILTANYKAKIIAPLQSRCPVYEIKIPPEEKMEMMTRFMRRSIQILEHENIEFDKQAVAALCMKFYPDFRRTIGELQRYSVNGKIDAGILATFRDVSLKQLLEFMKEKNFTQVRKWVAEHEDLDDIAFMRNLYNASSEHFTTESIPALVLLLARYQYQSAFVADKVLNLVAMLAEIMAETSFR